MSDAWYDDVTAWALHLTEQAKSANGAAERFETKHDGSGVLERIGAGAYQGSIETTEVDHQVSAGAIRLTTDSAGTEHWTVSLHVGDDGYRLELHDDSGEREVPSVTRSATDEHQSTTSVPWRIFAWVEDALPARAGQVSGSIDATPDEDGFSGKLSWWLQPLAASVAPAAPGGPELPLIERIWHLPGKAQSVAHFLADCPALVRARQSGASVKATGVHPDNAVPERLSAHTDRELCGTCLTMYGARAASSGAAPRVTAINHVGEELALFNDRVEHSFKWLMIVRDVATIQLADIASLQTSRIGPMETYYLEIRPHQGSLIRFRFDTVVERDAFLDKLLQVVPRGVSVESRGESWTT